MTQVKSFSLDRDQARELVFKLQDLLQLKSGKTVVIETINIYITPESETVPFDLKMIGKTYEFVSDGSVEGISGKQ